MSNIDQLVVLHFDFLLKAYAQRPRAAMAPFQSNIYLELLILAYRHRITLERDGGNLKFEICDVKSDADSVCFLINKHDKRAPNRSYKDYDENIYNDYKKSKNEYENFSIHLVVKKDPIHENLFFGLVEYQRGFSVGHLSWATQRFLDKAIALHKTKIYFVDLHPSELDAKGQAKKTAKVPEIELLAHADDSLDKAIDEGGVTHVEFIKDDIVDLVLDEVDNFSPKRTTATLRVGVKGRSIRDGLNLLRNLNKGNYSHIRIHYETEDNVHYQPVLNIEDFKPINELSLIEKTVLKDFTSNLSSGYSGVSKEVYAKIKGEL